MTTGFAYSQSFVRISSQRTQTKTGKVSSEERYYLSSQAKQARKPQEWIDLIRAHWAGVENRNHWRRDATLGEDTLRLKHPLATANLALLRSVTLKLLFEDENQEGQPQWLPVKREHLAADPSLALDLIRKK